MRKLILTLCVPLVSFATIADDPIVAQTLFSDGRTNTWTQADLISALQLMNRKYHRDVATKTGRVAWHGAIVGKPIVTTNETTLIKITTHEDGTTFTDTATVTPTARSVAAANENLPKPVMTTGVPAKLAAARLRRQAEAQSVSNVTVTVTAGEGN